MIRVLTIRDQIRTIAQRWEKQYSRYYDEAKITIGKRLAALELETATPADVAAIIGNGSWLGEECDQCGQSVERWVHIGEEPDYDASYVNLCEDCLKLALTILRREYCEEVKDDKR